MLPVKMYRWECWPKKLYRFYLMLILKIPMRCLARLWMIWNPLWLTRWNQFCKSVRETYVLIWMIFLVLKIILTTIITLIIIIMPLIILTTSSKVQIYLRTSINNKTIIICINSNNSYSNNLNYNNNRVLITVKSRWIFL